MRFIPSLVAVGILAAATLVGCGAQKGDTIVKYNTVGDTQPIATEAIDSGIYALYPSNSMQPLVRVEVQEGEQLGFRKKEDGKVVAFAKDQEFPLESKVATSFYWKFEKARSE